MKWECAQSSNSHVLAVVTSRKPTMLRSFASSHSGVVPPPSADRDSKSFHAMQVTSGIMMQPGQALPRWSHNEPDSHCRYCWSYICRKTAAPKLRHMEEMLRKSGVRALR